MHSVFNVFRFSVGTWFISSEVKLFLLNNVAAEPVFTNKTGLPRCKNLTGLIIIFSSYCFAVRFCLKCFVSFIYVICEFHRVSHRVKANKTRSETQNQGNLGIMSSGQFCDKTREEFKRHFLSPNIGNLAIRCKTIGLKFLIWLQCLLSIYWLAKCCSRVAKTFAPLICCEVKFLLFWCFVLLDTLERFC